MNTPPNKISPNTITKGTTSQTLRHTLMSIIIAPPITNCTNGSQLARVHGLPRPNAAIPIAAPAPPAPMR